MYIKKIKLLDFRNYDELDLSFCEKKNIFIGENAQGKTNVLEALYLCAFAKSFRTQKSAEMIRFGKEKAYINVIAESEELEKIISITLIENGKKMIKKDGKNVTRTAELLNNIVIVVFSPEDLKIIKDSPEKRRNFINKEISQLRPNYYENLKKYNDALRQKNSLLKFYEKKNEEILDVFDEQLAKYGREVIKYREEFVDKLSNKSNEIHKKLSGGKENLKIIYQKSVDREKICDEIKESRENDCRRGMSTKGPHRDDLDFFINGKDAKKYGSQGQQRTIALSLKLAEIRIAKETLGENPILLLDDVLSELDIERQKVLLKENEDIQLFITSTEVNEKILKKIENCKIFKVESGNINIE